MSAFLTRNSLRLCPFLCGGHRQLALENLALRQQLSDKHEGEFNEADEATVTRLAHGASVAIEALQSQARRGRRSNRRASRRR